MEKVLRLLGHLLSHKDYAEAHCITATRELSKSYLNPAKNTSYQDSARTCQKRVSRSEEADEARSKIS